jgi:lipopolysaccharide export system protein LptA
VRFTIERIRTLVLVCGVLLVVALGIFLAVGRFKSPFSRRDIPKRLGIDIEQEANGVTYTQAHGGHTLFKIHASKVVQLKNDHALLHNVMIELYGADGSRVDRITGDEFEYDQKAGRAMAAGPVEITLMRPGVAPAVAAKSAPAASTAGNDEIHVKTSGLAFDEKSGVVTTAQRVDFSMAQGSGSSMGASYDSQQGFLVLDRDVELTAQPTSAGGRGSGSGPVQIHAGHAEFYRDTNLCVLRAASAEYRGDHAAAADAQILFRDDGTAVRLEAKSGLTLATAAGGRLAAQAGAVDFDEHNQPTHGHFEGGVTMDSVSGARTVHGTSPIVELEFSSRGQLHHAHLERGVEMRSDETGQTSANGQPAPVHVSRTWRSAIADIEFRDAGGNKVEPGVMHGLGGVVITGRTQRGSGSPLPARLAADEVTAEFGPDSALTAMTGTGHASLEQTAATGTHDMASGDRLQAQFAPPAAGAASAAKSPASAPRNSALSGSGAAQVQAAMLEGNVVLVQQPAAKPGAPPQPEMRATAGRAAYEAAGEWLHLTESPRVDDGGLQLSADKIDVSQSSGEALAHGNVKGTWMNPAPGENAAPAARRSGGVVNLGGQGPAHVIAADAQLQQATGEATFRGNARLWQQVNSVAAPVIVLNRQKQMLVARTADAASPVTAVLVSQEGLAGGHRQPSTANRSSSVIRVRGGELAYSDADRKAVMQAGVLGAVTAETGTATSVSNRVELQLTPAASHASGQAETGRPGTGQVERMTATGHVVVSSEGRRGVGEQLAYTGADGKYRLTGTPAAPPKMTDPERGSVTGEVLIFDSRDDSVSIEGGAQETRTETTAPKRD